MELQNGLPPLFGDSEGRYRVQIVGNSGVGKSTLGAELAATLGVPFIALDTLFWLPGWRKSTIDEFKTSVRAALDQCERGWVVDGNYVRRLGPIVQNEATDIIYGSYRARSAARSILPPLMPAYAGSPSQDYSTLPLGLPRAVPGSLLLSGQHRMVVPEPALGCAEERDRKLVP
ncbi:hypothetical protein NM688_g3216 [Phlebia brevispora]|uniref:Uncharacterized protein n=1 Tax=Phlebia brevispora TaxID=194682 RepID=A0ACC1T6D4_9APHY|nr:hypothetical protein NM688_g3216 [Phlebia brevispora]